MATGSVLVTLTGCELPDIGFLGQTQSSEQTSEQTSEPASEQTPSSPSAAESVGGDETVAVPSNPVPSGAIAPPPSPSPLPPPKPVATLPNVGNDVANTYEVALNKGFSAARLSQSARAISDWELVVFRWQEALDLLETIKVSDPRAPAKIAEYRQNMAYAERQAATIPAPPKPIRVIAPNPQAGPSNPLAQGGQVVSSSSASAASSASASARPSGGTGRSPTRPPASARSTPAQSGETKVPIRRRFGGIPIIVVQVNGQGFPMMVDTGASTTVITQGMANTLGLEPTGSVRANTPSQQGAVFQVTRLQRLQVGNLEARNVSAAIAPSMNVGLLGQNFFGQYEVTITRSEVIFRRPS